MENSDVVSTIKGSTMNKESDVHKQSAVGVERLMKESLIQKTLDNITVVMVAFSGFEKMHSASNNDAYEDVRENRRDAESAGHSMHKPTLSASGLHSPDRLLNSYYSPLGNRSFVSNHNHSNDRTVFSSTAKKYQMLTGNSMDYGHSNSVDKGSEYNNWRTGN